MRRAFVVFCLAVLTSGCSGRSFEWREEVRLSSGEQFFMQRSGRVALQGEWATASYTRAISMRLELPEAYGGIVWEGDEWPLSLDRIDGTWWVVIAVRGYRACEAYGFPQEGLVAFAFDGSTWSRGDLGSVLDELTVNLGRPQLGKGGRYERVAYMWGEKYPRGEAAPLAEQIAPRRDYDSCIKIRPTYDPAREASFAAFAALAPADRAAVVDSAERDLPPIEKAELGRLLGERIGSVRVRDCGGVVSDTENVRVDSSAVRPFGFRIDFGAAGAGAVRSAYISSPRLQAITCQGDRAFVVLRGRMRERLIIVEYSREGTPLTAWSYRLPALDDWFGTESGMPTDLTDKGDSFAVMLVNQSVTARVQLTLPKAAAPIGPPTPLVEPQP